MTAVERIQQLLAELGPVTPEVAAVGQEPDGASWAIELTDETLVSVEFDAVRDKISMSVGLPKPPADRRGDVYEALLTYNMLWQDVSALRLAMDQPGGEIVQVTEAPAASLDVAQLQAILRDFVEKAALWRQAIAAGCFVPADETASVATADPVLRV